jgi:hypothetical protein
MPKYQKNEYLSKLGHAVRENKEKWNEVIIFLFIKYKRTFQQSGSPCI